MKSSLGQFGPGLFDCLRESGAGGRVLAGEVKGSIMLYNIIPGSWICALIAVGAGVILAWSGFMARSHNGLRAQRLFIAAATLCIGSAILLMNWHAPRFIAVIVFGVACVIAAMFFSEKDPDLPLAQRLKRIDLGSHRDRIVHLMPAFCYFAFIGLMGTHMLGPSLRKMQVYPDTLMLAGLCILFAAAGIALYARRPMMAVPTMVIGLALYQAGLLSPLHDPVTLFAYVPAYTMFLVVLMIISMRSAGEKEPVPGFG